MLVQNDKRVWFAGAFIMAVIFIWVLTDTGPSRRRRAGVDDAPSKGGTGAEEQYTDLIQSFKNDIENSKSQQEEMKAMITRTNTDLKDHRDRVTGLFENLVDRYEQLSREMDTLAAAQKTNNEPPPNFTTPQEPAAADTIEKLPEEAPPTPPLPEPPRPTRVSVIVPGDSVEVQLLTGVNAPVDGTPYPVVFQLNGPIAGPDGAALPLGEARLVAAAQGSEVDSRALFRLSTLSIRHPSGRRSVVKVDGWIVGEDGIRGMTGRLIDKLGRLILATAGVSFAAAFGDELSGGNSDNNNQSGLDNANGQAVNVAAASALTDASNRLGKLLLDRYESFVPVVEVLSNREAVAIFSQSAEINILDEDEDIGVYAAGYDE